MKFLSLFLTLLSFVAGAQTTPSGIPLNSPWKEKVYQYAVENLKHPAWGLAHAERDYQLTQSILKDSQENFDEEVLFASSYFHDLGGMDAFTIEGVDHAVRSAQLAEEKLPSMGFPSEKIPQVQEIILGHTYYGTTPLSTIAKAFRDADILDFLGAMGIARLFSATKDLDPNFSSLAPAHDLIIKFQAKLPEKISLPASQKKLEIKRTETKNFFEAFDQWTYGGSAR